MMNKTIGFIGSGNMGKAMMGGIIKSKLVEPSKVIICDISEERLNAIKDEFGVQTTTDSSELAKRADIIFLSVKPNVYNVVMEGIKNYITEGKIVVSIAAGKSIEDVEKVLGENIKLVRAMPNTPALVGEGMSALCPNKNVTPEEVNDIKSIFESFGKAEIIPEHLIDSVIGISGSSPAYVFMFIEAMADAAVLGGMARDKAYQFAAQAVLGSAKMVIETGMHPGELKDMVCSPAGTTIEAVRTFEEKGLRAAVIEAIVRCMEKSKEMSSR